MGYIKATLPNFVVGAVTIKDATAAIEMTKIAEDADGRTQEMAFGIKGTVSIEGMGDALKVSLFYNGRKFKLTLKTELNIAFGDTTIDLESQLTMKIPGNEFGDIQASGSILVKGLPSPLDGYEFKGEFSAKMCGMMHCILQEMELVAMGSVTAPAGAAFGQIELFKGFSINVPSSLGIEYYKYKEGGWRFGVFFIVKDKYKFILGVSESASGDAGVYVEAKAIGMGILQFVLDLTPIDPFAFMNILAESEMLRKIKLVATIADTLNMVELHKQVLNSV
jgi:hypothetical protein